MPTLKKTKWRKCFEVKHESQDIILWNKWLLSSAVVAWLIAEADRGIIPNYSKIWCILFYVRYPVHLVKKEASVWKWKLMSLFSPKAMIHRHFQISGGIVNRNVRGIFWHNDNWAFRVGFSSLLQVAAVQRSRLPRDGVCAGKRSLPFSWDLGLSLTFRGISSTT